MNNVLSAELYKLKYNKSFYVFLAIAALVSIAGSALNTDDTAIVMLESVASSLPIFLVIITSSIACDDYEKKTLKNLISSGNSRWHIYFGKLVASLIVGIIFFIVDGFAAGISGFVFNGYGQAISVMNMMESLLVQLLLIIVYVLTFFGFASITKSSKTGLMIGIVYIFGVAMIPWALGTYVLHTDLSAFSMDTLLKNIETLNFSTKMIVNFLMYGGFAVILNVIGYARFKRNEA